MAAPACPEMTTSNGHQDERKSVVMYALPGMIGHLVSTVELGKLFAEHGLKVIVVLAGQADDEDLNGAADSFLVGLAASHPGLSVHHLHVPTHDHVAHIFELARASNSALAALLPDFLCGSAVDVGAELGVQTYFFCTSCVAGLALLLHLPVIRGQTTLSIRDLGGSLLHVPGPPPRPSSASPTGTSSPCPNSCAVVRALSLTPSALWSGAPSTPSWPASAHSPDVQLRRCTASARW
jgi:hypothetical protein